MLQSIFQLFFSNGCQVPCPLAVIDMLLHCPTNFLTHVIKLRDISFSAQGPMLISDFRSAIGENKRCVMWCFLECQSCHKTTKSFQVQCTWHTVFRDASGKKKKKKVAPFKEKRKVCVGGEMRLGYITNKAVAYKRAPSEGASALFI